MSFVLQAMVLIPRSRSSIVLRFKSARLDNPKTEAHVAVDLQCCCSNNSTYTVCIL